MGSRTWLASGETPHGEVRDGEQREHRGEDHPEVGGDVRLLGELDEEVPEGGDDRGEQPEAELGAPAARGGREAHGPVFGAVGVVVAGVLVTVVVVVVVDALSRRT
jgi:hypothetical protein